MGTRMIPFFFAVTKKGELFGPFISLPADLQKRALEFMFYTNSGTDKGKEAIARCKAHESVSQEVKQWV
ncbi:hypothetical protein DM01DRAFT_1014373 [Hesseltinella vesiculosa]|uniref:Uncharacterized protein n=1 Tax=Hesseltinella vesiculosa TaxID=101127 RepID=A0A1X2GZW8_9FUNG|nr:hypothetical protein DM01DRAFT_1014373 [Hesseltinella vesiculosa]